MKNRPGSVYWSSLASSLVPYTAGEQPGDKKIIKLNTNENPYPPSQKVRDAVQSVPAETLRLYPEPSCKALREAVAARWNIKPDQVFAGNGSDEILAFAFAAFFENSGGKPLPILFPDISYSFYPVYAHLWNLPFKTPALTEDLSINPEDYKVPSGGVIFPNPNAPTGRALDIVTLKEIAGAQEKNKKVLIIDEAYIAFADKPGFGSMIPFIDEFPNLLIIRTLSKDASLAGLRAGFAVAGEELIEGLCRVRDSVNSYTVDRLAQAAARAAILDKDYYDQVNQKICLTRDQSAAALSGLGFKVIPSQANFIFVSPPQDGPSAAELMTGLREKGILVRRFDRPRTGNYLRVTVGTGEQMDAVIAACKEILGKGK